MKSPLSSYWLKWLGMALAISLAAMVGLIWAMRERYEHRLQRQIWPAAAPETAVLASPSAGSRPTVLLLGDSRMAQWGLPPLTGWRVVNAGAGGLTTGQIRLRTPQLLEEFHPDTVVVEAGINDLKFLGLRPALTSEIVALAASNLAAVAGECAEHHCQVMVLETWPAGPPDFVRRLVWSAAVSDSVNQLNARLRLLNSPEKRIRVVDLFGAAGLKPEAGLYRNTLHFKPEVYQRLTPVLEKELNATSSGGD
jgi:lysophospholipase L1-like esterase